jgi:hypothetical protein
LAERPVDEIDDKDDLEGKEPDDEELDEVVVGLDDAVESESLPDDETGGETEDDEGDEDESDEAAGAAVVSGEADDSDEASLDELLAKRAAAKRASDDSEEDIMTLVGGDGEPVVEQIRVKAQPIKDRQEFVCSKCRLVKPKVQLADAERGLCRDCV